jgi:hypothetical protein
VRAVPAALAALLLIGATRAASAQFQIGPVFGFHAPSSKFHVTDRGSFILQGGEAKQHLAFIYGGEARFWADRRIGFEASLTRGGSDVAGFPNDALLHATVTVGCFSALLRFPLGDLSNRVWVSGGAALVGHGGEAFKGFSHTSNVGAAVGVGTQFQLARMLRLDLGFRSLIYSMALRDSVGNLPGATQVDFNVRLGLSLSLGQDQDDY